MGPSVFATWEEAELLEVPMTTPAGPADARRLGVDPAPMAEVLGLGTEPVADRIVPVPRTAKGS